MKIEIKNLGKIKNAEFDIKPFTIFVGHNNTNKTWVTNVISGFCIKEYIRDFVNEMRIIRSKSFKFFEKIRQDETLNQIDLLDFMQNEFETLINELCIYYSKNFAKYIIFDENQNFLNDFELKVTFNIDEKREIEQKLYKTDIRNIDYLFNRNLIWMEKSVDDFYLNIKRQTEGVISQPFKIVKDEFITNFIHFVLTNSMGNYIDLPSERNVITQYYSVMKTPSYYDLKNIVAKIGAPNDQIYELTYEIGNLINYKFPLILKNFINLLEKLYSDENLKVLNILKKGDTRKIQKIADILEKYILGGQIEVDSKNFSKVSFSPSENISLPLKISSSMVKELSSLSMYLRKIAKDGDTLIFDEPEMNLHPTAIVQLTELFSIMVNNQLNLIVTTHSPYIIDHLINLMESKKASEQIQSKLKNKFFLKNIESFISSEKVAIYLFQKNNKTNEVKVKNILDREENLIDWKTFSNVSDKVSNLYFEIEKAKSNIKTK